MRMRDGFVSLPNVDQPQEMVDMLSAARAYQANLTAIGLIRDLVAQGAGAREVVHEHSIDCTDRHAGRRRTRRPRRPHRRRPSGEPPGGASFADALTRLVESADDNAATGQRRRRRAC